MFTTTWLEEGDAGDSTTYAGDSRGISSVGNQGGGSGGSARGDSRISSRSGTRPEEQGEQVDTPDDIPPEFYQQAWEDADHPMACVSLENKFLRINHAFERLLGYSNAELFGTTWMDITRQSHVGGDLASVQDVLEGRSDSYRLEKDYKHKRGHFVEISLTVRRFPRAAIKKVMLFRVEAPLATATRPEIQDVERHTLEAIAALRSQVEEYKQGVSVHVGNNNEAGGDMVGRDKTTNSDQMMKYMAGVLVAMCLALAYMAYYMSTSGGGQPVSPPNFNQPGVSSPAGPGVPR